MSQDLNLHDEQYLGDSVYIGIDDWGRVVLETRNGYPDDPRNQIIFNDSTFASLVNYLTMNAGSFEMSDSP